MTKQDALAIADTAPTPTNELLVELVNRCFKEKPARKPARKTATVKKTASSDKK